MTFECSKLLTSSLDLSICWDHNLNRKSGSIKEEMLRIFDSFLRPLFAENSNPKTIQVEIERKIKTRLKEAHKSKDAEILPLSILLVIQESINADYFSEEIRR